MQIFVDLQILPEAARFMTNRIIPRRIPGHRMIDPRISEGKRDGWDKISKIQKIHHEENPEDRKPEHPLASYKFIFGYPSKGEEEKPDDYEREDSALKKDSRSDLMSKNRQEINGEAKQREEEQADLKSQALVLLL